MPARDSAWRQPSDSDCGPSIQLTRKPPGCWVNSAEQEQVRHARGRNRHNPSRDASPAPGALLPNWASAEMQNLWPTLPGPSARECFQSNRVQRLAGNRRERS
jgi:hypothetical protein